MEKKCACWIIYVESVETNINKKLVHFILYSEEPRVVVSKSNGKLVRTRTTALVLVVPSLLLLNVYVLCNLVMENISKSQ